MLMSIDIGADAALSYLVAKKLMDPVNHVLGLRHGHRIEKWETDKTLTLPGRMVLWMQDMATLATRRSAM